MTRLCSLLATATPEQVFQKMGESFDTQINPNQVILVVVGLIGVLVLVSLLSRRKPPPRGPGAVKPVNHTGKLTRQIARQVGISRREMRKLKALAEQGEIENPLVLLLCPSVLKDLHAKQTAAGRK